MSKVKNRQNRGKSYVKIVGLIVLAIFLGFSIGEWNARAASVSIDASGYVKGASFLVFRSGTIYYAVNGLTGERLTSNTNFAIVVEAVLAVLKDVGGKIYFAHGVYTTASTIDIPYLTKSVTFEGSAGLGKAYHDTGTHFEYTGTAELFKISVNPDVRSAYGLTFRSIKFVGPTSAASVAINASNIDTLTVEDCTFLDWGYAIWTSYLGSTLPVAEQPGKMIISHNEFATGQTAYIYLARCTQILIEGNFFESFGPWQKAIWLYDSQKARIVSNEMNNPQTPAICDALVYVESSGAGSYLPSGIEIFDNWALVSTTDYYFVEISGTGASGIISRNNQIALGYDPWGTPHSPYNPLPMDAADWIAGVNLMGSNIRVLTFAFNTTYQNLYSPMTVCLNVTVSGGSLDYSTGSTSPPTNPLGTWQFNGVTTIVFRVNTGMYWRVHNYPTVTINNCTGIFEP